jgi:hypothetical protein
VATVELGYTQVSEGAAIELGKALEDDKAESSKSLVATKEETAAELSNVELESTDE